MAQSHLKGCFCLFGSKFWRFNGNLQMIFCQSVSAVWALSTLIGGGDTWTLTAIIKFIWTFLHSVAWMLKHCPYALFHPCSRISHLEKPTLPNIYENWFLLEPSLRSILQHKIFHKITWNLGLIISRILWS